MLQGRKIFSSYPLNRFFANVVIGYEIAVVAFQEKTEFSIFNKVGFLNCHLISFSLMIRASDWCSGASLY